jgi:superfamily II DNA or RNA helicase
LRVGVTATPTRKDGRALGVLYDVLLEPATVASLTAERHLVPVRYWSWPTADLVGVRIDRRTRDYDVADLAVAVNQPKLLGDIVAHWLAHAATRRTIAFTVDIKHAVALAEAFRCQGVAAEHVSALTPLPEREATLARFRSGATRVVCNCFVLAYGFDLPPVSCVVLGRPTRSLMLYLQMVGRALRPAPGKQDCLVLDHAGAVHRHGFIADERSWTLEGDTALVPSPTRPKPDRAAKTCPECHAVWIDGQACPECGYLLRPKGRLVDTLEGDLVEIGVRTPEEIDRQGFYLELRGYAAAHGFKPGWAAHVFREKFGAFPPWAWNREPARDVSFATLGWIQSRFIAWRKSGGRVA